MSEKQELACCPVCKGQPKIETTAPLHLPIAYWVECKCGRNSPAYFDQDRAVSAWNARDDRQAALAEALKD